MYYSARTNSKYWFSQNTVFSLSVLVQDFLKTKNEVRWTSHTDIFTWYRRKKVSQNGQGIKEAYFRKKGCAIHSDSDPELTIKFSNNFTKEIEAVLMMQHNFIL